MKFLSKARIFSLVKPDDISNGFSMDECEVIVK